MPSSMYFAKIAVALIVFIVVAELARAFPKWSALIGALPWITLLVIITRYHTEPAVTPELVTYLWDTFWLIMPTLLFIALMAIALQRGVSFYTSLCMSVVATVVAIGVVMKCLG